MSMQGSRMRKASRDSFPLSHTLRTMASTWNDQRRNPNSTLGTVKNESRCFWTEEVHCLDLKRCCPVSGNPQPGSKLTISYEPQDVILEVAALRTYLDSYQGGKGEVRSMEAMIQQITQDCANSLGLYVKVKADLVIEPGQRMKLKCVGFPK